MILRHGIKMVRNAPPLVVDVSPGIQSRVQHPAPSLYVARDLGAAARAASGNRGASVRRQFRNDASAGIAVSSRKFAGRRTLHTGRQDVRRRDGATRRRAGSTSRRYAPGIGWRPHPTCRPTESPPSMAPCRKRWDGRSTNGPSATFPRSRRASRKPSIGTQHIPMRSHRKRRTRPRSNTLGAA